MSSNQKGQENPVAGLLATNVTETKPRLRGWFHAGITPLILLAGLSLLIVIPHWTARLGVAIYLLTAVVMFGNSAVYHRFNWPPAVKQVFRRLDHSFIYVFIAGTYTPLCLTLLHGVDRIALLTLIWVCALAGLLFRIFWLSAPRALYTVLYVVMGWAAIWWMRPLYSAGGWPIIVLLILGGLVYTIGAVAYGFKRPNPWPNWFGFHEIFHLCTVIAAVLHFAAICVAIAVTR
ncbi:MAG: PAQR family membrane homeostasis protein TrhA [Propionibacteriaceae bacterium]